MCTSAYIVKAILYVYLLINTLKTYETLFCRLPVVALVFGRYCCTSAVMCHAILATSVCNPASNICDLGNLGGTTGSIASFINNEGDVAGYSNSSTNTNQHSFVYLSGTNDLYDLNGSGSTSTPFGLNGKGDVSGTAGSQAFLSLDGAVLTLLGSGPSQGFGLNGLSDIVAGQALIGGTAETFSGGTTTSLGSLNGTSASTASFGRCRRRYYRTCRSGREAKATHSSCNTERHFKVVHALSAVPPTCTEITIPGGGNSTPNGINAAGRRGWTGLYRDGHKRQSACIPVYYRIGHDRFRHDRELCRQ